VEVQYARIYALERVHSSSGPDRLGLAVNYLAWQMELTALTEMYVFFFTFPVFFK